MLKTYFTNFTAVREVYWVHLGRDVKVTPRANILCRMQLAHVIHTTRIASYKSTSQLPQDCRIQLEKSCRILKHVSKQLRQ